MPACHANGPIRVPHMFRICSAYVLHMFRTEYACHLRLAKPGLPQVGSARGSSCHVAGMAQFGLRPRLPKVVILRETCVYSAHMRVEGKGVAAYPAKSLAWVPHMFRICSANVLHSPCAAGSCIGPAQVEGQVAPGRPIADDLCMSQARAGWGRGVLAMPIAPRRSRAQSAFAPHSIRILCCQIGRPNPTGPMSGPGQPGPARRTVPGTSVLGA